MLIDYAVQYRTNSLQCSSAQQTVLPDEVVITDDGSKEGPYGLIGICEEGCNNFGISMYLLQNTALYFRFLLYFTFAED